MADVVPEEIREEILARLPVKTLLQFKTVCKTWLDLISSHRFTRKHLNHNKNNSNKLNLMVQASEEPLYPVSLDYGNLLLDVYDAKVTPLNPPQALDHEKKKYIFHILGSCDGLLLVSVTNYRWTRSTANYYVLCIWNPATGERKRLPQLAVTVNKSVLGFGCDPDSSTNYKVLLLESVRGELDRIESRVHIYTTHTNSWETLPSNIPYFQSGGWYVGMTLAYANLHYRAKIEVGDESDDDAVELALISFDLMDHQVRQLPWPPEMLVGLSALNGDLCARTYSGYGRSRLNMLYSFWIMDNFEVKGKESWKKLVRINCLEVMKMPDASVFPLHLLEDGQILISVGVKHPDEVPDKIIQTIACYHTENKRARMLIRLDPRFSANTPPVVYEGSLISPNSSDSVEENPRELK